MFWQNVALFTRAWIEIVLIKDIADLRYVALFTRAWIEMTTPSANWACVTVALFTRAWIEITAASPAIAKRCSRPLHEGVD